MAQQGTQEDPRLHAILAENVHRYRLKAGLAQEELSRRCGLHYSYVGRLERRLGNPQLSTMSKLAKALGVTVIQLLTPVKRRA